MVVVDKSVDRDDVSIAEHGVVRMFRGEVAPNEAGKWMLRPGPKPTADLDVAVVQCVELDMGMGSRVEGFRICGHR